MPGLLSKLLPREKGFHNMFVELAENVHVAAQAMVAMLEDFSNPVASAEKIKDIEHTKNNNKHKLSKKPNRSCSSPLDSEDIHEIASKIHVILDNTDAA